MKTVWKYPLIEKTVWKYPLIEIDAFEIPMPQDAQILDCQMQGNVSTMWALVDDDQLPSEYIQRPFRIVETGHPYEGNGRYVATFQIPELGLVFHLFDELEANISLANDQVQKAHGLPLRVSSERSPTDGN